MLLNTMVTTIIDISQVNMEELIRNVREEKVTRLLKQVIENNVMLLKLQKQLLELQVAKNQKRRREQEKEWRRKENKER